MGLHAKKTHGGNTNVPRDYSPNKIFGNWVANQRYTYRLFLEGNFDNSSMTPARIELLEKLGFDWCTKEEQKQQHTPSTEKEASTVTCEEKKKQQQQQLACMQYVEYRKRNEKIHKGIVFNAANRKGTKRKGTKRMFSSKRPSQKKQQRLEQRQPQHNLMVEYQK